MIETSMKPGWRKVKFGEVVRLSKARSQDPLADGIERYVGLEHLEPGDLRIRSWGKVADGVTFTSVFQPGQVLFGKRRAYQRKVAVADFSGVCSGDIYVLETKDSKVLLPELLPFICQTDAFFDHAVGTSAGSLSPRTNWTSLADFEFVLPPMEEQARAVKALQAAADSCEALEDAEQAASALLQAVVDAGSSQTDATEVSLQDLCDSPITYGIVQAGPHVESGVPYIRVSDMTAGEQLSREGMLRTSPEIAERFKRSAVSSGDIVFALRGVVGLCRVVPDELDGANLTQGTARISIPDEAVRTFVYWALRSTSVRRQIERASKGSTFKEITLASLRTIQLRVPSVEALSAFNLRVAEIAAGQAALRARLADSRLLFAGVRNSALGA